MKLPEGLASDGRGYARTVGILAILVVSLLLFSYSATPFTFYYMTEGLDGSWVAASSWAQKSGLTFGSDFIFTAGPLSILYHHYFDRGLAIPSALIWSLCVLVFSLALTRLATDNKAGTFHVMLATAIALLAIPVLLISRDSLMFFACLLLPVSVVAGRRSHGIELPLAFAMAAFSLAKFSVFPLAVLAVVISDLMQIGVRRIPLNTITFGASIVALFLATGGALADLGRFLIASSQVASGYTAAMSISGATAELRSWVVIALLLVIIATLEVNKQRSVRLGLLLVALGAYLWICLKAGFVRHDPHSLAAWAGVSSAAMIWAVRAAGLRRTVFALCYAAIAVGTAWRGELLHYPNVPDPVATLRQGWAQISAGLELVHSPTAWLNARQEQQSRAMETVKMAGPLPPLIGTIDMIPSAQSEIIANGLTYRPRPTVQEYTTYSSELIARNRDFFTGNRAPDFLLFRPGSIDGRHPASAEGALWPLFMTRYEPVRLIRDYLLLQRRNSPLNPVVVGGTEIQGSFEETIAFPRPSQPAFVSIDVRPNLLGRLVSFLFKPPELRFELTFEDAAENQYRLIPDISRDGMILAPTIDDAFGYGLLASGIADASAGAWPISIRVTGSRGYSHFYDPTIRFRFASIDLERLRQAANGNPIVNELADHIEDLRAAKSNLKSNPPRLFVAPEGIFAHAPSAITVPTEGAKRVRLGFGILKEAYTGQGKTDGVCFSLRLLEGGAPLFERCLDPRMAAADQGTVGATVDLPIGTREVVAETACRASCDWDWSYWSRIRPEQP